MPALKNIDNGKEFDRGKSSDDYAKYRGIYPDAYNSTHSWIEFSQLGMLFLI